MCGSVKRTAGRLKSGRPGSESRQNTPMQAALGTSTRHGARLTRACFTVNNYTDEEYQWLTTDFKRQCSWIVIGKETGENETPHLQGAFILLKQTAFSTIKTYVGLRRAHLERMQGQPVHSLTYCTKQDSSPFVHGDMPLQGKRNDIHSAVDELSKGKRIKDLAKDPQYWDVVVKYMKGLTGIRAAMATPRSIDTPPTIYWLYGETGTGKSRYAWEYGVSVYGHANIYTTVSSTLQWFDGYDGQQYAIFEDFRSKGISFSSLLRIFDRYPHDVPYKGGFTCWNPAVIVVTTPHDISATFSKRAEHIPEDIRQLERRVTKQFNFNDPAEIKCFRELYQTPSPVACEPGDASTATTEPYSCAGASGSMDI